MLPKDWKTIGVKWVDKTKKNPQREVQKYKARLVTKGQAKRMDRPWRSLFPISRLEAIRLSISLVA